MIPVAGQMVVVRNRPGVVRDVFAYGGNGSGGALHLIELEYLDGWEHPGQESVLWEREVAPRVVSRLALPDIAAPASRPDAQDRFGAYLDAVRWSATARVIPRSEGAPWLLSPWQSAVQVEDYQLYPVLKALLMPRVNLLLADDVGLGKTIEAGLILTELIARRRVRRILVVCPAALQQQWQDELRDKFGLESVVMDRDQAFRIQRELGTDANPWTVTPRAITSMDYLRQRDVLDSFLASATRLTRPEGTGLPWDVLVVDEAHNLAPARFGDDSLRTQMLRELTPHFEHRLFLTATPHNGYTLTFSGLLELLDPVRFAQTTTLTESDHRQIHTVMVRRLKSELNGDTQPTRFPIRTVESLPLALSAEERDLYDALRTYRETGLAIVSVRSRRERNLGRFVFSLLTKRLLSSSYAFARTWWEHVEGFALPEGSLELADIARERAEEPLNDDAEKDERDVDAARQGAAWLRLFGDRLAAFQAAVGEALSRLGWTPARMQDPFHPKLPAPPDAKWTALASWINNRLRSGGRLRDDERVILFTEYKDTLAYLLWRMRGAGIASPVLQELYGGAPAEERERVKAAFNDPRSPLRILLATDAASEGLNLQTSCRYVIHQEIPWNPMRLEQRNGRVDRHNQARDVFVFHFHTDEDADLQFLSRVAEKVDVVREDLGSVGQVIDQTVLEHFTAARVAPEELDLRVDRIRGLSPERQDLTGRDAGQDNAYRDAMAGLESAEAALGLAPPALARLLAQALVMDGGTLAPAGEPGAYRVQAPPAWKALVDETLRIRKGDLQGALPKVTFDAVALEVVEEGRRVFRPRPDTVLLRLGHPVMRRALGTLRRRMWDDGGGGLTRWTVVEGGVPDGVTTLLLVHVLLTATNPLHEVAHAEVVPLAFDVRGADLVALDSTKVPLREGRPVTEGRLATLLPNLRTRWLDHREIVEESLATLRQERTRTLEKRLAVLLKEETAREREKFATRKKELQSRRLPKAIDRLRQEAEQTEQRLVQSPLLFREMQEEEERRLREIQWEVHRALQDQLLTYLEREEERVLTKVLPRRFALARLDVQPVAVEYRVTNG
jgi:superfamily II DNA or RNA helicase